MIIINKKIIILLFLSIFLTSCLNNNELDNTNVNNSTNIINTNDDNSKNVESIKFDSNGLNILQKGGKIGSDNKIIETTIETKVENNTLSIGKDVVIQEGLAKDFPSDFPIINGGKVYKNSNMKEYGFIIINNKDISEIVSFYTKELKTKGWIINTESQEKDNLDIEPQENNIKELESASLTFTKEKENNILKEVNIDIKNSVPTIIKDNLKIDGKFIEISFKNILIEQDNLIEEYN